MRVNPPAGTSMDPGALDDWRRISQQRKGASTLDLIIAFLNLDMSRYKRKDQVPDDMQKLVEALNTVGSRERQIVDSVLANEAEA